MWCSPAQSCGLRRRGAPASADCIYHYPLIGIWSDRESRLLQAGFQRCDEAGATTWNFLMSRPGGAVVDLNVIERDEAGNGVLGPPEHNAVYPAAAFAGRRHRRRGR